MNWSSFDRGVFLVNVLGIVHDPQNRRILIGKRENDPILKELSWCFPGGRPQYGEELTIALKREVKIKTGLIVNVGSLLFAKTYPENHHLLSLYYPCTVSGGKEQAGELFTEIQWVKPAEVKKYFTTSLHPTIADYLASLK